MRVLVTGASGYIGRHLENALDESGHMCRYPSCDYDDAHEAIIHLAWDTDTAGNWHANLPRLMGNVAHMPEGSRFVFASTLTAEWPRDTYDREKALGELIVKSRPDIEAVILRLGAVYGPGKQNKRSAFNAILRQIHNGEQVNLYGNCHGKRDFTYIDDVVEAFVQALTVAPGTYDVGRGERFSLTAAAMLASTAASGWPTTAEGVTANDMPEANVARFLPGWTPRVPLSVGITRTLDWFRATEPARELVGAA